MISVYSRRSDIWIKELFCSYIKTPVFAVLYKLAYFWWRWPLFELFLGLFKNFLEFVFCFSQLESNCKLFGYSVNFIFAKIYGKPCQSSFRAEKQNQKSIQFKYRANQFWTQNLTLRQNFISYETTVKIMGASWVSNNASK